MTILLVLNMIAVIAATSTGTPSSGTTAGGQAVTIAGTGFQPDAMVTVGGVAATGVVVASATSLTAVTPHHPAGVVDVAVINPGSQIGTRSAAYTFVEPANGVRVTVTRSGNDLVLTWPATGQTSYTIYRNTHPVRLHRGEHSLDDRGHRIHGRRRRVVRIGLLLPSELIVPEQFHDIVVFGAAWLAAAPPRSVSRTAW